MKPEADQILFLCARQWMGELAPQLPANYAQSTASLDGMLTIFAAQEYEHGADLRMRENNELRALLAELAPCVPDAGLRGKLEDAAQSKDVSLKISALNASNEALKHMLIALQIALENTGGTAAADGVRRIWDVLAKIAERRVLIMPSAG